MNEKKSKNIIIIALCITLIFMGVGFSLLTQNLEVNTTANVVGSWDVHFKTFTDTTSSLTSNTTNQGTNLTAANILAQTGNSNTTVNVEFNMFKPGDQVQYTGVVKNYGNIDAILTGYTDTLNSEYITKTVTVNGTPLTASTGSVTAPSGNAATIVKNDDTGTDTSNDEATIVITYTYDSSKTDFPTKNYNSEQHKDCTQETCENDAVNNVYRIEDHMVFTYTQK